MTAEFLRRHDNISIEVDLIMKINKIAAFALCLTMLAVTGCSGKSESESGSSRSSSTTAAASVQTSTASSSAAETSKSAETPSAASAEGEYSVAVKGDKLCRFKADSSVWDAAMVKSVECILNMKTDSGAVDVVWNPAVEDLKKTVKEREKGYKSASGIDPSSVKSDIVKCNGIDAGWICYTRTQGGESTVWSMYMFPDSEGTIVFNFSADADKYEKCVPEFEKILNTVTIG